MIIYELYGLFTDNKGQLYLKFFFETSDYNEILKEITRIASRKMPYDYAIRHKVSEDKKIYIKGDSDNGNQTT